MKLLLLEDEYALRISIEEFLIDIGYDVESYANGDEAYDAVFSTAFDLLLLDVNVPGLNGFELLKELRKENVPIPAIFITSMTSLDDLKVGYKSGCCDYIRKPFDLTELQLRMEQVIKSFYHKSRERLILAEGLEYDTTDFSLSYNENVISLSKTEKDILGVLLKYKNQVVSMDMFQDEVWGEYVDPANIRVQVNNLRKKMPIDVIQNRRGMGYILPVK